MSLETMLGGWTGPSSATEQDKQQRTERMVKEAVASHPEFAGCALSVYTKGSYANNTNVRTDSDVDIAVECTEAEYWDEETVGAHAAVEPYFGVWTPEKLRYELTRALQVKFPGQVNASSSTALTVHSSSARVDADVVPCFSYRYYFTGGGSRPGTVIYPSTGPRIINYPAQQLANGALKNRLTNFRFKKAVRIMKRVENAMTEAGIFRELPSYFVECLIYNCPNDILAHFSWTETVRRVLIHIWDHLQGDEPLEDHARWVEVNDCFYLFHPRQKWTRADGREFALAAWNYLGFS